MLFLNFLGDTVFRFTISCCTVKKLRQAAARGDGSDMALQHQKQGPCGPNSASPNK